MKNKRIFFTIISMVLLVIVFSCKKENPAPAKSKTDLITEKIWSYNTSKLNGEETILDCEKGNTYQFFKDGKYKYKDFSPVCTGDTDSTGVWYFSKDEQTINLVDSDGTLDFKVETLTTNNLVLVRADGGYTLVDTFSGK